MGHKQRTQNILFVVKMARVRFRFCLYLGKLKIFTTIVAFAIITEVRNSDHSPSWQCSSTSSLVSSPNWRLRNGCYENEDPLKRSLKTFDAAFVFLVRCNLTLSRRHEHFSRLGTVLVANSTF